MASRGILKGLDRGAQFEFRLRVVREVLDTGCTHAAAARKHGISAGSVNQWVRRYLMSGEAGLETRLTRSERLSDEPRGRWRPEDAYEPTPDEIDAGCLRIQATWSEQDKERRWVGRDRLEWLPPELVGVDDHGDAVAWW